MITIIKSFVMMRTLDDHDDNNNGEAEATDIPFEGMATMVKIRTVIIITITIHHPSANRRLLTIRPSISQSVKEQ